MGRIAKAHGVTGEVVVELVTDRTERLDPGTLLSLADGRQLQVERRRPHQGRWLVEFEGVSSRSAAEGLRGLDLLAPPLETADDTLWVHELVGTEVRDPSGRRFGTVAAVERNPASDLLVLEGGALVPLHFVVAHEPRVSVTVELPEGLLDPDEGSGGADGADEPGDPEA